MIPIEIRPQVEEAVAGLTAILGDHLVGVYLHGSAVLGCFGANSDIDLLVVSRRPLIEDERRRLVARLLKISAPGEPAGVRRPIELDLVLATALRPWRYPTPFDFHYGESHRARFEAGELEPWELDENPDLAAHVTVVRHAGIAIKGRPIADVFPEVPWDDYAHALGNDLSWFRDRLTEIPRYAVLSGPRIWATLATGIPHSKASGAEWALPRLSAELRPVLEHGLTLYRGDAEEDWRDLPLDDYIEAVATEIEALTQPR